MAAKTVTKIVLLLALIFVVSLVVLIVVAQNHHTSPKTGAGIPSQSPTRLKPPELTLNSNLGYFVPHDFSLQERIGQLLFVGVPKKDLALSLESKYQIGGFLLTTGSDLFSADATNAITNVGRLPPLFAIDQEGGEVSRLPSAAFKSYTAAYLATLPDSQVQNIGQAMGQQMVAIGARVNFAPVLDLNNGKNAAISQPKRSFGTNPTIVSQKAMAFAAGLHGAGVAPTFKHFPGLGNATGPTNGNTDTGPATTPPLNQLEQNDLKPYENLQNQRPALVMVGNQIVPDLTNGLPASLSPAAYQLLRTKYGFTQVVCTDEIADAKAVNAVKSTPGDAVVAALQAGADMPLVNVTSVEQVDQIITTVTKAVLAGQLSDAQLTASLNRVMQLKTALKS